MVQCYECGTVYPETMRCCPNCGSEAKIQLAPNSEFEEPKNPYVQLYRPYGMPMNNRMNGYAGAGFVLSWVARFSAAAVNPRHRVLCIGAFTD